MCKLEDLKDRRLANLDSAITYYQKRLATYRKKFVSLKALDTPTSDQVSDLNVLSSLIKEVEDFVNYLKLC